MGKISADTSLVETTEGGPACACTQLFTIYIAFVVLIIDILRYRD